MKQRKRIPWGQVIGTGLSLAMGVGCGVVLTSWFDRCPAGVSRPLWALGLAAAFLLALLAQITLHEGGHLVCGLLSGYRFCSFRVGSLMWMKVDGHLRLRRLRLAGTDGQCLMSPPDMVDGRLPVTLYNFGGALANLLFNLITSVLDGALYDEFQRRAYAEPDLTGERAAELYGEVCDDFGCYDGSGEFAYDWVWVSHNFDNPFYYISYAASALGALELYDLLCADFDAAADKYLEICGMDTEYYYYTDALEEAGLHSIFDESAYAEIAETVEQTLAA